MRRYLLSLLGILVFGFSYGQSITPAGPISFCQGSSVTLTVQNAPTGTTRQWQLNGGNIGGATANTYVVLSSGNYSVRIVGTGIDTVYGPVSVTVFPKPVVNFSFNPDNQCGSVPVAFTNSSTGAGLTYRWNFDDPASGSNNTSTTLNPVHHFVGSSANGNQTFNVKLIVTTSDGCVDSLTKQVRVSSPSTILTGPPSKPYDGKTYFTQCSSLTSATFTFFNSSTNNASNSNFRIVWGDNTPDFVSTTFPISSPQTHTYGLGDYSLLFIVTNTSGCTDTGFYYVFVGSNPAVGLENPGNTTICTGSSLTFPISGTAPNQSNTIYTVNFNDGSGTTTFPHPAPSSITHTFNRGSCGFTTGNYVNSFAATITASNPCLTSSATVAPIYVSQKPKMGFGITPADTICVGTNLTATNTSGSIDDVINGNCNSGKSVWSISPAVTPIIGDLGTDNGVNNPNVWTTGTNAVTFNFTVAGTYTIKLKGGNQNCGIDSSVRTICVNPRPVASFTLSGTSGCAPLSVTTTNNSNTPLCGGNTYQWSVSYSNNSGCTPNTVPTNVFAANSSATSAQPQFIFANPGVYTINLITRNSFGLCSSVTATQTVTVKAKPQGSIVAPAAVCQNGSINPTATVRDCYGTTATSYTWSFPGATPLTSVLNVPGAVTYNTSGTFAISLKLTNECGDTTLTKSITVNPAPDVTVPANKTFCAGEATGPLSFSSAVPTATFAWTNSNTSIGLAASGTGNIPSFTAANPTASPITATITVTPTSGCSGVPQSFTITVNPRPAKPTVVRPVSYCLNETALPLSGTASSGNTLVWYSVFPLANGSATPPTPTMATAGTATYYVTQANSYTCESDTARIVVTVNPKITNNAIAADQTICGGSPAVPLTQQGTLSGGAGAGTYFYQWQDSSNAAGWTNVGGNTPGFNPGSPTADTKYRRIVTSASCRDTSNVVTITVQGSLTNTGINSPQTICFGTQPDTLRGQVPNGGGGNPTYQWQSSPTNANPWTNVGGATGADYLPPVLTTTMYYRRIVSSGQCSVTSGSVQITVNPKPAMTTVPTQYFCNNSSSTVIAFSSSPAATSYQWVNDNTSIGLAASGSGNIASFTTVNNSNPKVPVTANIKVAGTFTANGVGCVGDTGTFRIIVLPAVVITPKYPDTTVCTGQTIASYTPKVDTGFVTGVTINYVWTVTGSGISLTSSSGSSLPAYTTANTGTTDLTATVTVTPKYTYGGKTCDGTPMSYVVTVKPSTAGASAGLDQVLCAQTTATLTAAQPPNTGGNWTQIAGAATITTPNSNITTVTGLVPGTVYQFVWTQTGFASCPATKDTVVIDNKPPLANKIDTATKTICAGASVIITGQIATGGGGSYAYQWQSSTDGITFNNVTPNGNSPGLTVSPTVTTWYRRSVTATPCNGFSDTVKVNVQPALANNSISANATICTGNTPPAIVGSAPAGGDGLYSYRWEQNTGTGWSAVTGATVINYAPGILTQTTQYRRIVSTTLCAGPLGDTSNVVTITVNPDAKALFLPTDTLKCPPFIITPAVINLKASTANSGYIWYANGVQIGTGTNFPGYTVAAENDSVTIKLVVVSAFGCKADSLSQKFKTIRKPTPSFTLTDTVGCGPITVSFTNTSTYINSYNYFWDFGNGQTSTAIQPGSIAFAPNPAYGDTTYVVKLKVFSPCDTLTFSKSIRVKSKPKALFTPTKTTGCSPMKVKFKNNSKGTNNTYFWNFGDGTTLGTAASDTVEHEFITGVVDTFYVKLKVTNECGADSLTYAIVVAPNSIKLNLSVNGTQRFGCAPHTVSFINNTQGASVFYWTFGDGGSTTTTKNVDTVSHTFSAPGTYTVKLQALNNCSDTTTTETIVVYPKPKARFTASTFAVCIGDSVKFINQSDSATAYLWKFGDGATSILTNPSHTYTTAGSYTVVLYSYRNNPSGNVCNDSTTQTVTVSAAQTGLFTASDTVSNCAPLTVTFVNKNKPSVTAVWDFGDGATANGDSVVHTYQTAGVYTAKLTVRVPGGCTYITTKTVTVLGPKGTLLYNGGYVCSPQAMRLQAVATGASNYVWDFGDGQTLSTTQQTVFHPYANPGYYLPQVTLVNGACNIVLKGIDTVKVDKVDGGFRWAQTQACGATTLTFTDTSHVFFGVQSIRWNFGDNTTGTGSNPSHAYAASGRYTVQMIVVGKSGCTDTVSTSIDIAVKSKPIAGITAVDTACTRRTVTFNALVQTVDAVNFIKWDVSNGASGTGPQFTYTFTQSGTYDVRLVVGTVNGCYDTARHTIRINPSPAVIASNSLNLCKGDSVQLNAIGAATWQWLPLSGLSCYTCPNPIAKPGITTPYIVEGRNGFGCADWDTVVITVIQPLKMTVSPNDSICVGSSTTLLASGASSYNWSPSAGLSATNVSNPIATPTATTRYRVVGYDGFNCFTDTAFITVAIGQYPTVSLGPDVTLTAGTLHPLTTTITNGPIRTWNWTPATNLSCANCALPVAEIKKDITYIVKVTTAYGCPASDTINIKVTCSQDQVFIPNAFSPDNDGVNDVLMVRARGVVSVKYFRVLNRWGELVFEQSNFKANDPLYGWNGKVKGQPAGADVFVYTCEAMCENGAVFSYKGNVTLVK